MKFKTLQERREEQAINRNASSSSGFGLAELFAQPSLQTSEQRLENINSWHPDTSARASRNLAKQANLKVQLIQRAEDIKGNKVGMHFFLDQLDSCLAKMKSGESLVLVSVIEMENIVGYGYAKHISENEAEIEIIKVEQTSTRSAGLRSTASILEQEFSVGVGHIVVDTLVEALKGTIYVNAKDSSRFIFKSLGFVHQPVENPCLLWLQKQRRY